MITTQTKQQQIDDRAVRRLVNSSRAMHDRLPSVPLETWITQSNMPRHIIRAALLEIRA